MEIDGDGGIKNRDFRPISRFISETTQDRAMVAMKELVCDLSNGAISSDLE